MLGTLPEKDDYQISFITYLRLIVHERKISHRDKTAKYLTEQINTSIAQGDKLGYNQSETGQKWHVQFELLSQCHKTDVLKLDVSSIQTV